MRRRLTAGVAGALLVAAVVAAACGGATNQTITPGQGAGGTSTSAAALPTVSPTSGSSGTGTSTSTPSGTGTGNAAAGKAVFAANCASCHGPTGAGTIGPNIQNVSSFSIVQQQVTNGGAQGPDRTPGASGVIMPAFKTTLTQQQINDVAAFVAGGLKG